MADAQQHIAAIRAALEIKSADGSLRSLFEERKTFIDACNPEAMRAILAHIEALEAERLRVEWLTELLRRAQEYVKDASTSYYDGTDGASIRQSAGMLSKQIDAAIDAAREEADRG
jgi:hypothetical protein